DAGTASGRDSGRSRYWSPTLPGRRISGRPGGSTSWHRQSDRSAGGRPPRPGPDTSRAAAGREPAGARPGLAPWPPEPTGRGTARRPSRPANARSRSHGRLPSRPWPLSLRQRALAEDDEPLAIASDRGRHLSGALVDEHAPASVTFG